MSDVEEPPAKIAKTDMTAQSDELQEMDEGQEEWLSEGLLTDDDNYQPPEQDGTDSNVGNTSQEDLDETFLDETLLSGEHSAEGHNVSQEAQDAAHAEQEASEEVENVTEENQEVTKEEAEESVSQEPGTGHVANVSEEVENVTEENQDLTKAEAEENVSQETDQSQEVAETQQPEAESIEQTLNSLENQNEEMAKKNGDAEDRVEEKKRKEEKSDGNDTDDLLRLLGDNDDKTKKKVLIKTKDKNGKSRSVEEEENDTSDDDDEYIFNSSTVQKLRVAKNALVRKPASKAEPEDMSEGDDETDCESSDEADTLKTMFAMKKQRNKAAKSTAKPPYSQQKKTVRIGNAIDKPTPKRPAVNSRTPSKPILKTVNKMNSAVKTSITTSTPVRTLIRTPVTKDVKRKSVMQEHEEIINEEEFLEEDDFDLDENFAENSDMDEASRSRQTIMRPEQMDEEVPTDAESHSDSEASMYDELPSSDSEGLDDWFSLDIRAERASDFLPMLGDKAYELLMAEKKRVAERLTSLRQSVAQLHCSGKSQAELLRKAAVTLAELDDMLKAA